MNSPSGSVALNSPITVPIAEFSAMVRLLALISLGGRLLELASHGSELYSSSSDWSAHPHQCPCRYDPQSHHHPNLRPISVTEKVNFLSIVRHIMAFISCPNVTLSNFDPFRSRKTLVGKLRLSSNESPNWGGKIGPRSL